MSYPFARPLSLAIALALSAPALAQQAAPGTPTNLDTMIVTGTRASGRTVLESTAPVDVLSAEDIRKAGVVNGELGSALQALLPSFNFPRQSNSGGADHIRAAQLRGLSPDQVLVLVNGKRRHTSALVNTDSKIGKGTTPVDFNAIPVSAIKRIEVLRDGAGAQYGSDAVAGVINVILDDDPDSGALEASFGANHTDVKPIDRTVTDGHTSYASAKVGTRLGDDGGFFKVGLELKNHEGTNRAGYDQIPPFEAQTPANLALAGKRNYVLGDGASKDLNAWINGKLPFGQSSEFYFFGTYNQRDTQGANYFRYPDSDANWTQIYPNGYRPVSLGENRDLQGVAGARGQWGEWAYDASVDYGRNDFTYRLKNSLNASLGPGSTTRFKTGDYAFEQSVANLDLSRSFDDDGATHTLGSGVELRREHYRTRPGDPASYAAGAFTDRPTGAQAGGGLTPQDAADLSRNVASVYTSLSSQFGDKLSTDLAARYEHYQDFGGELTGKLAARYEFVPAFALRGAISNNFHAPSLSQIGYEATSTGYDAAGQLLQGRLLSVNNPIAQALGARAAAGEIGQLQLRLHQPHRLPLRPVTGPVPDRHQRPHRIVRRHQRQRADRVRGAELRRQRPAERQLLRQRRRHPHPRRGAGQQLAAGAGRWPVATHRHLELRQDRTEEPGRHAAAAAGAKSGLRAVRRGGEQHPDRRRAAHPRPVRRQLEQRPLGAADPGQPLR